MPNRPFVVLFVRLAYWESYFLSVVLTATVFRRILYIWIFVALLMLTAYVMLLFRSPSDQEWAVIMRNFRPVPWALSLPVLFVFGLPLLSSWLALKDKIVKRGVNYQFSDSGIRINTVVSTTDLLWDAIPRVSEFRSAFLVFTNPRIAFMLPKRCFDSAQDIVEVRELFRGQVTAAKLRASENPDRTADPR
jgi:hypothetical protein